MLTALSIALICAVLLCLLWLLRGGSARSKDARDTRRLHQIDLPAFRNLLSVGEDEFLRSSLTSAHYRRVRRARLRAVQEYLVWIAEDCVVLIPMLEYRAHTNPSSARETAFLIRSAWQIRLISSILWALLWGEYFFVGLKIQPLRLLRRYEEFRSSAGACLRLQTEAR
jgi:hypothetical protein